MRNLWLGILLVATLLTACHYQPSNNKYVVGIINPNPNLESVVDGFRETLSGMAQRDGKEVIYIQPPYSRLSDIDRAINEIKEQNIDLILTSTSPAAIRAKELLKGSDIPIVFAPIYDPIRIGLVDKLVGHGGNITGVKNGGSNPKALEWLLTIAPNIKRILVPFSDKASAEKFSLSDLQQAANKIGVELVIAKVDTRDDLKHVLEHLPKKIDALWLLHSTFLVPNSDLYIASAIKHKIPVSSGTSQPEAGVMVSYGQNHEKTGRQAGRLAYQILTGVPPADLPIETADFFLGINLVTAKAAGVHIPYEVLLQAQEIIRNGDGRNDQAKP